MASSEEWLKHLENAINEMLKKYVVILKRGDLIDEEKIPLYKETIHELIDTERFLGGKGTPNEVYRHLQLNVFMKHESFFMDLFETNEFPQLFELFELE